MGEFAMALEHAVWIGSLWAATLAVGALGLPVSRYLFSASSDGGYAFSKILGWFAVGYFTFLIATLRVAPLPFPAIMTALTLWAVVNAFVWWRTHDAILPSWPVIATAEILFLSACAAIVVIKGFHPEIYQIERFMDFGFVETLRNSTTLPLSDLWLAGETVNYYYLGHIIGFVMLTLSGIPSVSGFFVLVGGIAGMLAAAIARFAIDVGEYLTGQGRQFSWGAKLFAAGTSVFIALCAGTWYMIPWAAHKLGFLFGYGTVPNFFYPEPTRIIPGTITEMPIFSFLVADTHAHVWGMLTALLVLALGFAFWRDRLRAFDARNAYFWAFAFALGAAYMVNSWDAATLGLLVVLLIAAKHRREPIVQTAASVVILAAAAFLIALPWSITNHLPVQGVGLVRTHGTLWQWLSFWGPIVTIIVAYAAGLLVMRRKLREHTDALFFVGAVYAAAVILLAAMDIVFMKDILINGEWYRANTVFKLSTQVWIWVASLSGPIFLWSYRLSVHRASRIALAACFALYLIIGAVYPVIAVEQAFTGGRTFVGVGRGLDWWQRLYPDDYAAYLYLKSVRDALPQSERLQRIVEAEGDSYTDVSRFSVFLGWPTIVGWPVHEWTWRGSYDIVGKRRDEVREIYTGTDPVRARQLLTQYDVHYIILGAVERDRYGDAIQEHKLRSVGTVIFEQGDALIIRVR